MTRRHPRMCLLGFGWRLTILRGSKPPKKHSRLLGWSRINSYSRWRTADILQNVENAIYQWTDFDETWWSHPIMSPTSHPCVMRLPWLPSNGALYIQQLGASGGRTREPILLIFDVQQQIRTTMTVTWPNIKIFKIQNVGRPPCSKTFEMP